MAAAASDVTQNAASRTASEYRIMLRPPPSSGSSQRRGKAYGRDDDETGTIRGRGASRGGTMVNLLRKPTPRRFRPDFLGEKLLEEPTSWARVARRNRLCVAPTMQIPWSVKFQVVNK
jgi:hypothetical protein